MNLFGLGKKKRETPKKTSPEESIDLLDSKIETLYKRDQFLNTKVEICKKEALAKKKRGDKTGALIALKKANKYQSETKNLQATIMNLENQKMALESATVNADVIKVLDTTNQTLKSNLDAVNPDKVDQVIEDMEDLRDHQDQINEALTRNADDIFEDEDLLAELDGLEDELEMVDQQEKAPAIPQASQQQKQKQQEQQPTQPAAEGVFNFPSAPQGKLQTQTVQETEEEKALRELQETMMA